MSAATPSVDLESDGRRHGFLMPAPGGASAAVDGPPVPLTVLRRGAGPRLVLVAGAGGEDAIGALALQRLARELDPHAIAGTTILLPHVPPAAAGTLGRELLDRLGGADLVLELVATPPGLAVSPMAAIRADAAGAARARAEAAMIAFGAPESARLAPRLADGPFGALHEAGVPHVRATLGGAVPLAEALDIARIGCRNALIEAGALDAPHELRSTRLLAVDDADALVRSPGDGLLELRVRPGGPAHRGHPLALLVDPTRSGAEPIPLPAPRDGIVLAARRGARVRAGQLVAVVADEVRR